MDQTHEEVAAALSDLQKRELSIIRLSAPIFSHLSEQKRSSDASADAFEHPTPASLAADLAHYKEYFSKLRFSYISQVTKEKFLRAIIGDPPQIVESNENARLEDKLVKVKADLKAQKVEVAAMVEDLEKQSRDLSRRYENVSLETIRLSELPMDIARLQDTISALQIEQQTSATRPSLTLPLPETMDLVALRERELQDLDRQLETLKKSVSRRERERDSLEDQLPPLAAKKQGSVAAAIEARRRKEEADTGAGDDLELQGRWYRSAEAGLQALLDVEG